MAPTAASLRPNCVKLWISLLLIQGMVEKGERLQEVYSKLAKSLEHTEGQVTRSQAEFKALVGEQEAIDRASTKVRKRAS